MPGAPDDHCLPLIRHLARVGTRAAEELLVPTGLRARHIGAMRVLRERGPTSQQALVTMLNLDPSNVVGLLNELEERGLVVRRRDPADRRRHIVELSTEGQACLRDAQERLWNAENHMLKALSFEQRASLYELLEQATGGWLEPIHAEGLAVRDCGVGESDSSR